MQIEIHSYVLRELQTWKGRWPAVADGSGVSIRTIEKIARREIADPGVSHIEKLATFFAKHSEQAA
jgi:transcriptional regulator with XRE-family HTH domain